MSLVYASKCRRPQLPFRFRGRQGPVSSALGRAYGKMKEYPGACNSVLRVSGICGNQTGDVMDRAWWSADRIRRLIQEGRSVRPLLPVRVLFFPTCFFERPCECVGSRVLALCRGTEVIDEIYWAVFAMLHAYMCPTVKQGPHVVTGLCSHMQRAVGRFDIAPQAATCVLLMHAPEANLRADCLYDIIPDPCIGHVGCLNET